MEEDALVKSKTEMFGLNETHHATKNIPGHPEDTVSLKHGGSGMMRDCFFPAGNRKLVKID